MEIAWGADLTADSSTWVWTDITTDIRYEDGPISIKLGRSDEASDSQPAECSFSVTNTGAKYSLGPQSPSYPNVRRNTPLRVRATQTAVFDETLFQGYVTGFTPTWNLKGNVPVVSIGANGSLRRIQQLKSAEQSALYRFVTSNLSPVYYWPLEEGKDAKVGRPVFGNTNMTFILSPPPPQGKISWGATDDYVPTKRAPVAADGGGLVATLQGVPGAGWALAWAQKIDYDDGSEIQAQVVFYLNDPNNYALYFTFERTDGLIGLIKAITPTTTVNVEPYFLPVEERDGIWHFFAVRFAQNGTGVDYQFYVDGQQVMNGNITDVDLGPGLSMARWYCDVGDTELSFGHIMILTLADFDANVTELNNVGTDALLNEDAVVRLSRLCAEDGVEYSGPATSITQMGAQFPDTFLNLVREIEATDQGIVYDGTSAGLTYVSRESVESSSAALTIDVASNELAPDFAPTDDDQRVINKATADQREGSEAVYEDRDGPLGTNTIGLYDGEVSVNVGLVDLLRDYAAWVVHKGTVEGYRFPSVSLNLRATPSLAAQVAGISPTARIDIINPEQVFPELPSETISLVVEGIQTQISPMEWTTEFACSRFEPWRVIVLAADTGDTDPELCHLDTDDSELVTGVSAGATSLSVATNSGPLWTTATDDFPFEIEVGGVVVNVTAISGATSPQTFTVDPVSQALTAGDSISVYKAPVLGL
ncbi:hypothetical protein [Prauserella shujinwangii]|uniref:hypothetical protein n=1 Tax=Prauserella shujinwangii TaxID=1453103 RepID=UPI0011B266C3|nr:hypothetical protein [Prauserella shujinwangii]